MLVCLLTTGSTYESTDEPTAHELSLFRLGPFWGICQWSRAVRGSSCHCPAHSDSRAPIFIRAFPKSPSSLWMEIYLWLVQLTLYRDSRHLRNTSSSRPPFFQGSCRSKYLQKFYFSQFHLQCVILLFQNQLVLRNLFY